MPGYHDRYPLQIHTLPFCTFESEVKANKDEFQLLGVTIKMRKNEFFFLENLVGL